MFKTFKKCIDIYIAPSSLIKCKLIEGGFRQDKIRVKPNFVDIKTAGLNHSSQNFAVYMGRLSKEKGVSFLIDAWMELKDISLKIIGTGPLEEKLRTIVDKKGMHNIDFLGYISGAERFDILSRAMFLTFPSECYESFGLSIIESYACGVPVIGTDLEGIDELIINGRTGYLFKKKSVSDLVAKINLLKENPDLLLCLREQSLEFFLEKFAPEVSVREMRSLMNSIKTDIQ